MTKTKTILGISLAAVFAVSMIGTAFAAGHLTITDSSVRGNGLITITTSADIPLDGSDGAFGYGVIGSKAILAITTHGGVGPDTEAQDDAADPVMHTHAVTLTTDNPNCALAIASASFETIGNLSVDGDTITITGANANAVGKLSDTVVAFTLSVPTGNPADGICVEIQ